MIASNGKLEVEKVKIELNNKFDLKDLGVAKKIIEIYIIKQYNLKHMYVS